MPLSEAIKTKYKLDTKGRNTVEMAKFLKNHGVKGFLISISDRTVTMRVPQEAIKSNRKIMDKLRRLVE